MLLCALMLLCAPVGEYNQLQDKFTEGITLSTRVYNIFLKEPLFTYAVMK